MKKSKIIAPALGVLVLSTAAAVTGTVAWFTASRIATISNTAITAYNPESGLQVVLSGAKGASINPATGSGDTAAVVSHEYLRDASVNLANASQPAVYRSVIDDDGNAKSNEYTDVSTAALAGTPAGTITSSSKSYYYCSIYTATFSLTKTDTSETYDLVYDHSKMVATNTNNLAIAPALRIGIYLSSSNFQVIAPFNTGSGAVSYVDSATSAAGTYTPLRAASANTFSLGTLTGAGTQVATIYTWFEGTDPACINGNENVAQSLSVSLGFKISLHTA